MYIMNFFEAVSPCGREQTTTLLLLEAFLKGKYTKFGLGEFDLGEGTLESGDSANRTTALGYSPR